MLLNNRVVWNSNGTYYDISNEMSNINNSGYTIDFHTATDYIYFGSELPFNHRYISIQVTNNVAATANVAIWDGTQWQNCVDVKDFTSSAGNTLGQSGIIMWTPDPSQTTWAMADTNYNGQTITGLSGVNIRNLYWARLHFSANLKNTMKWYYVGHKFSDDNDLKLQYPDLIRTTVLNQFVSGKTTWEEQHIIAAEYIIRDLQKKGIIKSKNQILDWRLFTEAAVHKVAEIIYNGLGTNYREMKADAHDLYNKAIDLKFPNIDLDGNAELTPSEKIIKVGYLKR